MHRFFFRLIIIVVTEEIVQCRSELWHRQLRIQDHLASAGVDNGLGIELLMVVAGVRIRNEDPRQPAHGDLCQEGRSGATDDNICRCQRIRHIVGVFEEAEAFVAQHTAVAVLKQEAGLHIAGLASDEDHLHIRIGKNACERQRTDAVDRCARHGCRQ